MKQKTTKRAMSMALAVALSLAPVQAMAATDVSGHWAEKVIKQWQNKGLISGYQDGTFKPNNNITRAEFVLIMNNAMGFENKGTVSFKDVKDGDWFKNAVAIAVGEGYTSGYQDGTFKPNATITRAEAAVMIAKAAGLGNNEAETFKFSDNEGIPAWARGSVGAVVKAGYMSGYPDGTFGTTKSITRAEAVSSLNRMLIDSEEDQEVEVSKDVIVDKDDTIIKDQVIEGDLIITKEVGDGEVTVKDTTVKGDIIVRGGGDDSIYLENVTAKGIISVEKKDVRVQLQGSTTVSAIEVKEESLISSSNFTGSVDTIIISKDLDEDSDVTIKVPADKVKIDAKANIKIQKNIKNIEVSKKAEKAEINIYSGVKVNKIVADAKINISGSGTVEKLEANADGIKIDSKVNVNNTDVADGVSKPTSSGSSSGGGGGSSSDDSSSKPTAEKKELKKELDAANQKKAGVKISKDGTDITVDQKWVTQEMMNTFESAIASAKKVYDTSNSKNTVKNATKELQAAIVAFKPESGKKVIKQIEFKELKALDGESATTTTTKLKVTLSEDIDLVKDDIAVEGATLGEVTDNNDGTYEIAISKITVNNGENVTVTLAKEGYTFNPASKAVAVNVKAPEVIAIRDLTADGESGKVTTTELTLTLAKDIDLVKDDVAVEGATLGEVTDNNNGTYTIAISKITVNNGENVTVTLAKEGYTFNPASKAVAVNVKAPEVIAISDLTANGTSGTETTTELTLTLAKDIDLVKDDVAVEGATLGEVTDNNNGTYTIAISDITVSDGQDVTVTLTKEGYTFNPASKAVAVNVKAETKTTAAASGTLGQGTKGQEYNSQNTFTVTLTNGKFNTINTSNSDATNISVEGLPEGLKYAVAATDGAETATITISGTPTAIANEQALTIKVKVAALKEQAGVSGELIVTGDVKITVVEDAPVVATTAAASGTLGQGTKGQEYNSQNTFTVTLTNGKFNTINTSNSDATNISVEGLPEGLKYAVAATDGEATATITISGTPTAIANEQTLTIKVKVAALKEQTGVSGELNVTGDVKITVVDAPVVATTAAVSGTLGNGTFGEVYPGSSNTLTVTLTNGTFNTINTSNSEATSISVEGLPAGFEYSVAATDGEATATITISGTPTAIVSNQDLTIKVKEAALKEKSGVTGEITATGTAQITVEAKSIAINALTADGESGKVTTTELTLTLAKDIDLVKCDVAVEGATLGEVTDNNDKTYTIAISDITVSDGQDVTVTLTKEGYTFNPASKTVAVNVKAAPEEIAIDALTANGTSGTETTTELTLTLAKDIDLVKGDVAVEGATLGEVTDKNNNSYTIAISDITVNDGQDVTVTLTKEGYTFTGNPKTVAVNVKAAPEEIAINALTADGESGVTTTTELTLTLAKDINLADGDVEVTGATKGLVTDNNDKTYTIVISDITVNNGENVTVTLTKEGYTFTDNPKTVIVYKGA